MRTAILSFVLVLAAAGIHTAMGDRPLPATGGAAILDNDQLIEGDIRREGNLVVIRKGGSEISIPASRVIDIVADRRAAVQAMRARSNRHDPDERLRLVRWCLENNLRTEAVREAEELLKSRPQDAKIRNFVSGLRDLKIEPENKRQKKETDDLGRAVELEPLDYNPESYALFATRVQPILMNVCIGCHHGDSGGSFKLIRADGSNSGATVRNLSAALKHLNRGKPSDSPLLIKSITAHGNTALPPLRDRQHPAFAYLEKWAFQAVVPDEGEPRPADPVVEIRVEPKKTLSTGPKFGEISQSKPLPVPQTEAKDPFDPAIFNGTIQPMKK